MGELSQAMNSNPFSEAAIFSRVVENSGEVSAELAEHMLSLDFAIEDKKRVEVLLQKNAAGEISEQERKELENLNHVADLISLWHSRARRVLNPS
ncbi:MAG: hypothetical protein AAGA30_00190 [Planctomycetota bacterium]